jgi:hypothetical protein
MRPIFRGFFKNWFGIGPLHYISSRSDFGFEFSEICVIEKRLPDSRRIGEPAIECLKEKPPELESRRLPDSASQGVAMVSR